jgi:predicted RNase H-like HicB family nuclease
MQKINFKSVLWKEGKHYVAQCLNVEVSSFGKTKIEALKNLGEALSLYFEDQKSPKISKIDRPEIVVQRLSHA